MEERFKHFFRPHSLYYKNLWKYEQNSTEMSACTICPYDILYKLSTKIWRYGHPFHNTRILFFYKTLIAIDSISRTNFVCVAVKMLKCLLMDPWQMKVTLIDVLVLLH